MKLRWFLRDHWRVCLFFIMGYLLMMAVVWLAAGLKGLGLGQTDAAYALLLGVVCLVAYLVSEYMMRRPFYREVEHRLNPRHSELGHELSGLDHAATFQTYRTEEQRLFLKLLHQHNDQYVSALKELESRQSFYEEFTTRFAHQMKTPVTVLQLLVAELELGPETFLKTLADMREEIARLDSALGTMLYTARMTSFEFDARMEPIDLVASIREVINEHKSQWIRRSIYPRIELTETPDRGGTVRSVYATTDKKWLLFIADQIIRNTLQYGYKTDASGSPAGERASFVVTIKEQNDSVTIQFSDEGIGIPERDIHRVFDPFYTGTNGRAHSRATGMGLYLVGEVAGRLGHQVGIDSVEGKGTTVTLTILTPDYHRPANEHP